MAADDPTKALGVAGQQPAAQGGLAMAETPYAEEGMTLGELVDLLVPHVGKILAATVLGGVVAFLVTFFLVTPQYQATSKIYVVSASNNSVVNLSDLQIGSSLAKDYEELLLVRPLLEDLIGTLGLDVTTRQLSEMISISNPSNTRILAITVTSPDPQTSADVANEMVNQACVYLPEVMECEEPNVAETAIVPTAKSSPSYSRNVLLGALVGLFLAVAAIVVRDMLDDTVKTPEDVQRLFGVAPLATVPEMRVAGGRGRHRAREGYGYGARAGELATKRGRG